MKTCGICGGRATSSWHIKTPTGKIPICSSCGRERDIARRKIESVDRNKAAYLKRKLIVERGPFCQQCGRKPDHLHAHHVNPLRWGGANTPENLLLLCTDCHRLEHAAGTRY